MSPICKPTIFYFYEHPTTTGLVPKLSDMPSSVLDSNAKEMHITRTVPLVIIADLEVALGRVQTVRAERLLRAAIEANTQHAAFIPNLVREDRARGNGSNLLDDFVPTIPSLLDTQRDYSSRVVEQLANRLAGDAVVDVDLSDHGAVLAIVRYGDGQTDQQPVLGGIRIPGVVGMRLA